MTMHVDHSVISDDSVSAELNNTQAAVEVVSNLLQESHRHYTLSLLLSCLYTVFLFPVGFVGNLLILVVNLEHRRRLSVPDLYFVNLAAADLALVADSLIEVFNLKSGFYYELAALCTFMNLFQQVTMYSSVFFLTWMSFDRYVALTGLAGRSVQQARLVCCLVWVSSSLLTVLPFVAAQWQHAGELHFCFADVSQVQWLEVTLGFLLPFCVMGACYWRIARLLRHSSSRRRPRRQKPLWMISAAVLVFFLCWLPESVFVCVHLLRGGGDGGDTLWQDYPLTGHAVRLAAFSNSCLNPLIYSFLGETFQDKLRLFFRQRCRHKKLHRSALEKSTHIPAAGVDSRTGQITCLNSDFPPKTAILHSNEDQLRQMGQEDKR